RSFEVRGHDALEERVRAAYEKWVRDGGCVFRPRHADRHHDAARFVWDMGGATLGAFAGVGMAIGTAMPCDSCGTWRHGATAKSSRSAWSSYYWAATGASARTTSSSRPHRMGGLRSRPRAGTTGTRRIVLSSRRGLISAASASLA